MTTQKYVSQIIKNLPQGTTLKDVLYDLCVRYEIEAAQNDEELLPHDEVMEELFSQK